MRGHVRVGEGLRGRLLPDQEVLGLLVRGGHVHHQALRLKMRRSDLRRLRGVQREELLPGVRDVLGDAHLGLSQVRSARAAGRCTGAGCRRYAIMATVEAQEPGAPALVK